jgi:hypothetical protein
MDCYDRDGNPISLDEWMRLVADLEYKRIEWTEIPDVGIEVSTVWLGLNHNFLMEGPPYIFETMVFGLPNDMEVQERWATEEEAIEGHWKVVQEVVGPVVDVQAIRKAGGGLGS